MQRLSTLLVLAALAALAAGARADNLVGQVVDSNGLPVPGLDIDVKNNGSGGDPAIANDGTDAGGFFNVTLPPGNYDVIFNPAPPPISKALPHELEDVVVSGVKDLGVVVVPAGVALSGRLLTQAGLPVGGVNIDVIDEDTGENVDILADTTDAFGNFLLAVPDGSISFRVDPTPSNPGLAPLELELELAGDADVGDQVLVPGFPVSGILLGVGGAPLSGVDIDVFDAAGDKLYTPADNSQGTGFFSVTVPSGAHELWVCPNPTTRYLAQTHLLVVGGAPINLGVLQQAKGWLVSGHVSSSLAAAEVGVDLDVKDVATGLDVPVCADTTNALGNYLLAVPAGTLDFTYSPKGFDQPLGAFEHAAVAVAGDLTLNAVLPDCPFPAAYGVGSPGTGGLVPSLSTVGGTARPGNGAFAYQLDQALPGSAALLAIGFAPTSLPLFGGTVLVDPLTSPLYLVAPTGGGSATIGLPVPLQGAFVGFGVYAQAAVVDPGPSSGLALSNGVQFTICD